MLMADSVAVVAKYSHLTVTIKCSLLTVTHNKHKYHSTLWYIPKLGFRYFPFAFETQKY